MIGNSLKKSKGDNMKKILLMFTIVMLIAAIGFSSVSAADANQSQGHVGSYNPYKDWEPWGPKEPGLGPQNPYPSVWGDQKRPGTTIHTPYPSGWGDNKIGSWGVGPTQ